jgi:hypothetical protein
VQEKATIATFEPKLMVVNDDVCGGDHLSGGCEWMLVVYSRLRGALQRRLYSRTDRGAGLCRCTLGDADASKGAIGSAKQLTP